ncbi:MAG: SRPBCC family protein [Acidobacteriota bacterium]
MPRVTRKTVLAATPDQVYDVVSDPRRLADWWPRVVRVENVDGRPGAERTRWTNVLAADSGRKLRLDYRCIAATRPRRYVWEHELEGTPFEEHMSSQTTEVRLASKGDGTEVSLKSEHGLKGTARLAGFMMRKSQREMLNRALAGLESLFA